MSRTQFRGKVQTMNFQNGHKVFWHWTLQVIPRGIKVPFCCLCCSHSRQEKYNEAEENRAELVTPMLPLSFKVPVAYLCPVNSTQPSSREDLGSNKGLTLWSSGLWPCWRQWPAKMPTISVPSPLAIPAPSLHLLSSLSDCIPVLFTLLFFHLLLNCFTHLLHISHWSFLPLVSFLSSSLVTFSCPRFFSVLDSIL